MRTLVNPLQTCHLNHVLLYMLLPVRRRARAAPQVISAMALHALRTEKDSVEFYKSQGDAYDGFREALLPDRDQLQHYCLPWQTKPKVLYGVR